MRYRAMAVILAAAMLLSSFGTIPTADAAILSGVEKVLTETTATASGIWARMADMEKAADDGYICC